MAQAQIQPTSHKRILSHDFVVVSESQIIPQNEMPEVFRLPSCSGHNLYEISVDEIQHLFTTRALTSVQYVQFCLDRVQRVIFLPSSSMQTLNISKVNPYLEAVIETNPEALDHAKALDEERRLGKIRGPLHGVPVFVKDVRVALWKWVVKADLRRIWRQQTACKPREDRGCCLGVSCPKMHISFVFCDKRVPSFLGRPTSTNGLA